MATMLELHTRQVDTTAIKRARKNEKEQLRGDKAEVPPWDVFRKSIYMFTLSALRKGTEWNCHKSL